MKLKPNQLLIVILATAPNHSKNNKKTITIFFVIVTETSNPPKNKKILAVILAAKALHHPDFFLSEKDIKEIFWLKEGFSIYELQVQNDTVRYLPVLFNFGKLLFYTNSAK